MLQCGSRGLCNQSIDIFIYISSSEDISQHTHLTSSGVGLENFRSLESGFLQEVHPPHPR